MSFTSDYYIGDKDQYLIETPYGKGLITKTRTQNDSNEPSIQEIRLLEWEKAAQVSNISSHRPTILYSTTKYETVSPKLGDDVMTPYGRGTIIQEVSVRLLNKGKVDPVTNEPLGEKNLIKYHIQITSWKLAGRSRVKCYLFANQVKVVRKKTLMEMNAEERVEFAMKQKKGASILFAEKKYQTALNVYAGCIEAVRYIQHDMNNDNECRADLIDVMVTCSNNAATCCIQLKQWEEAFKYAKNALILLTALFGKRGAKIYSILNKDNGHCDAKLFGEWRIKSRIIMATALFEKEGYDLALEELRLAREHIAYYVAGDGTSKEGDLDYKAAKASVSKIRNQEREIIRLKTKITEKKKELLKIERARAQAMFRDTKEESTQTNGSTVTEEQSSFTESTKNVPKAKTESRQKSKETSIKKKVSFAANLEETREIQEEEEEEEEDPWYEEHIEAIIVLGLGALAFGSFLFARKSLR